MLNLNAINQHVFALCLFAFPLISWYQAYPILMSPLVLLGCSLLMGLWAYYTKYTTTKNLADSLRFIPSGECKEEFDSLITSCGVDPKTVNVRYGYSYEQLAVAMFDTICIDPLIWHDIDKDPVALETKGIIEQYIVPTLPEDQKGRVAQFKELFSVHIQRFILKHELAHVFHRYSTKKLILDACLSALVIYIGLSVMFMLVQYSTNIAIFAGIVAGAVSSAFLSLCSMALFNFYEEKKSDLFAAQYSSKEELLAAADFWEKHQEIINVSRAPLGVWGKLPSRVLSGHPDGAVRAQYLRELAEAK